MNRPSNFDLDSSEKNSINSDFVNDPLATKTTFAATNKGKDAGDSACFSQASQPNSKKVKKKKFISTKIRSTKTPLRMTPTRRAFNFKKKEQEAVVVKRYTQGASKDELMSPNYGSEKAPKN